MLAGMVKLFGLFRGKMIELVEQARCPDYISTHGHIKRCVLVTSKLSLLLCILGYFFVVMGLLYLINLVATLLGADMTNHLINELFHQAGQAGQKAGANQESGDQ